MARLAGLTALAAAVILFAADASCFTLTVKANGGCTGFQFVIKKSKYTYNETLGNVTYADGCSEADLAISKLYIPGACAKTRSNNFDFSSLNLKSLNCDTVDDYSEATCNTVFDQAPDGAIVGNITTGEFIDYDSICWPADVGFAFVKNTCTKGDARVAVDVKLQNYDGSGCDIVKLPFGKGVGLSPGAIVGIVIAAVVVVIILALLLWCCCCQLRR